MSRHLLTFVLVLVGLMLLMRTCQPPKGGAVAVRTEPVPDAPQVYVLEAPGVAVRLAPDGSVVSIESDGEPVVRNVTASRRPFHVFLRFASGATLAFAPEKWRSTMPEPGVRRFVFAEDEFRIVKTIRLAEDGRGLDVDLQVEGPPDDARGVLLTGVSGVVLGEGEEARRTTSFWELADGAQTTARFKDLEEARRDGRGLQEPARRQVLGAKDEVARFGVLGDTHYVALEDLPPASELSLDAYRARRGEDFTTNEIEAWLELITGVEGYEGRFRLRWLPRAEVEEAVPWLAGRVRTVQARKHTLENETFRAVFTERGAAILEMWLKTYSTDAEEEPSQVNWVPILRSGVKEGERALTLSVSQERYGVDPADEVWEAEVVGRDTIRFTLETERGITFTKTVRLPPPGRFDLEVDVVVTRPEDARGRTAPFSLVGPAGSYVEDAFRGSFIEPPQAVILEGPGGDDDDVTMDDLHDDDDFLRNYGEKRGGLLRAICTRGSYFVCALIVDGGNGLAGPVRQAEARAIELVRDVARPDGETSKKSMLGRVRVEPAFDASGRAEQRFRLYAGPTETDAVRDAGIENAIDFGFFGIIGRALMALMKLLQSLVGSYGLAIMLMTLCVRALLLPVSYKTQLSMQRYQKRIGKIKPLLDEVQKKHAKDPQKMNQERMRVMREHKVGLPLGCLMIFFQIPIWFALFQALRVEFAIRHESFLWAADLSRPDQLLTFGFWPYEFNVFPLLMLVLWVFQQKVAPTAGSDDPQVQMQMKMMRFMPYVFFIFLYKYAAALAIYMCMSSAWSIVEGKLVRKAVARST